MTVRTILKMGDPRLYQRSSEVVDFNTPELDALIEDMFDTMEANDGAGLAAPQIGVMQRLVIFSVDGNPRYPEVETVPRTVLINPQIEILDQQQEAGWEGCLSIPAMRGLVHRPVNVHYSGFDAQGNRIEREASDFHARVVLHECDHLDGILYPMRISDIRQFGYEAVLFGEAAQ